MLRLAVWPTTARGQPSPPGKSRPLSGFCCLESLSSMLSLREQRLSASTPAPSKQQPTYNQQTVALNFVSFVKANMIKMLFQRLFGYIKICRFFFLICVRLYFLLENLFCVNIGHQVWLKTSFYVEALKNTELLNSFIHLE